MPRFRCTDDDTLPECIFALGTAFENAGVDIGVVSTNALPAFMGGNITPHETNLDVVQITNVFGTHGTQDGHINKRGIRYWDWDTKGHSGIGSAATYGIGTKTYQPALDNYFADLPYMDHATCPPLGDLDPVAASCVEDVNDNGVEDKKEGNKDGILEGDHMAVPINFSQYFTIFDIDDDGNVELPFVSDPSIPQNLTYQYEYTKAQVLKHTITHELGHAAGMLHNSIATCLMHLYTEDWSRDDTFSSVAKGQMSYHNN